MREIMLTAPASLPLAIVNHNQTPALLSLTIQHPPLQLTARKSKNLFVSGARAQHSHAYAQNIERALGQPIPADIAIDLATPRLLGLQADPILAVATARALTQFHNLSLTPPDLMRGFEFKPWLAPAIWAAERGGLQLVALKGRELPELIKAIKITHSEANAWALVLHYPRFDASLPPHYEAELSSALPAAAASLPASDISALWHAVGEDDLPAFAHALAELHQNSLAALELPPLTTEQQTALQTLAKQGALAVGRSLTGQVVWGLVQGNDAVIRVRTAVRQAVGHYGGTVMATITDNKGIVVQQANPLSTI